MEECGEGLIAYRFDNCHIVECHIVDDHRGLCDKRHVDDNPLMTTTSTPNATGSPSPDRKSVV